MAFSLSKTVFTYLYSILSFMKSVKNFIADVKLSRYCTRMREQQHSPGDATLLITPLYLYNSVSRILCANAFILSSIPGSCIAAPALFAVSIIANCPGR